MLNNGRPLSAAYNDGVKFCGDVIEKPNDNLGEGIIPKVGMIILYNEIIKWQDRKMARPYRGCGIVTSETQCLIFIDMAIFPGCFIKTSFPKSDFRLGLIQYVQLKDYVYKKEASYRQLDVNNLNDKIKGLVVEV